LLSHNPSHNRRGATCGASQVLRRLEQVRSGLNWGADPRPPARCPRDGVYVASSCGTVADKLTPCPSTQGGADIRQSSSGITAGGWIGWSRGSPRSRLRDDVAASSRRDDGSYPAAVTRAVDVAAVGTPRASTHQRGDGPGFRRRRLPPWVGCTCVTDPSRSRTRRTSMATSAPCRPR
jgi:hypothetical protein